MRTVFTMLFLLGTSIFFSGLYAQRTCGHDHTIAQEIAEDPTFAERLEAWKRESHRLAQLPHTNRDAIEVYTIPVVVHVVYNTPGQNISLAQVQSQIDVLNEDFRRLNADTANTPAVFQPLAADVGIEFCLATIDPDGNQTDGITRTQTTNNSFNGNHQIKYASSGGKDGWPRADYLNIWVGPLAGGLLGYATFPTVGDITRDGVVVGTEFFGRIGDLNPSFDLGRTLTHEVGHWLGLFHPWANCAGDDGIPDTPQQQGPNFGCPTFPQPSCNNGAQGGDMFMNFMDYSDDVCFNMFTVDQTNVMRALFQPGQVRHSLLTSPGCDNLALNDAGIAFIHTPEDSICGQLFDINVELQNYGIGPLTIAEITVELDNNILFTQTWNGNLDTAQSETVFLGTQLAAPGSHLLRVYTNSPNNGVDFDANNDASQKVFFIANDQGTPAPFSEGFENATFPLADWELLNPDNDKTWTRTTEAAYNSEFSLTINGFDYTNVGAKDAFILPQYELSPLSNPGLVFYLAYQQFEEDNGFNDTLEVWASDDCGQTYELVYQKWGSDLATVAANGSPFVPANSGEWRREEVELDSFATSSGVYLQFRFTNQNENNIWVDNINLTNVYATSISDPSSTLNWSIRPNPAQEVAFLMAEGPLQGATEAKVFDPAGRMIRQLKVSEEMTRIDLQGLQPGIYVVQVRGTSQPAYLRLLVN